MAAGTVILGAFLPMSMRHIDTEEVVVNMRHLSERFELLTIVALGEMVTGVASFFSEENFTLSSLAFFADIVLLFGSYVVHNHYFVNRSIEIRGTTLIFSHYAIIIGINLVTADIDMGESLYGNSFYITLIALIGYLLFFIGLFSNVVYYDRMVWKKRDFIQIVAIIVTGMSCILLFYESPLKIVGQLIMTGGIFVILLTKWRQISN